MISMIVQKNHHMHFCFKVYPMKFSSMETWMTESLYFAINRDRFHKNHSVTRATMLTQVFFPVQK